jgi:hypothetical protein
MTGVNDRLPAVNIVAIALLLACVAIGVGYLKRARRVRREAFVRSYVFPSSMIAALAKSHPRISENDQLPKHFAISLLCAYVWAIG